MSVLPAGLPSQDADFVRRLPLFEQLSDQDYALLMAAATVQSVGRRVGLFMQGDPAERFFVVLEGWVKLYRVNRDGTKAVVRMVSSGESFAEAAMLSGTRFPVSAQAVTDLRVLSITATAFARCVQSDFRTVFAMLGFLSMRLHMLDQQIEQLQVQSAPQRVGSFLLKLCPPGADHAVFKLPLEKTLVAKRLSIQPETLSRALAKLRPVGVEVHGSVVSIRNIDALRKFCREDEVIAED